MLLPVTSGPKTMLASSSLENRSKYVLDSSPSFLQRRYFFTSHFVSSKKSEKVIEPIHKDELSHDSITTFSKLRQEVFSELSHHEQVGTGIEKYAG